MEDFTSFDVNTKKAVKTEENDDRQFVTFEIAGETYGVSILRVQEIIGMTKITEIPNSLAFMRGVINLRGSVVPVIDMRKKFKLPEKEYDFFTVIIIVEVAESLIGMIVDTVSDVMSLPVSGIQETPNFSTQIETDFIEGIGQKDNTLIIILNVDRILTIEEREKIEADQKAGL
ncbi:MAG TPA: chemotaxis protein CheW [Spirochaetota bacterium]|nr:chemotaxis protein CheW [Spirochaetota bacterium]HPI88269.1 chemotaxis protein CheW [Spirochaetota bacterium]HPR50015.1 chemotaxis protein CheW [Spirochaetota bacterium]